jgi:hypothetical protein
LQVRRLLRKAVALRGKVAGSSSVGIPESSDVDSRRTKYFLAENTMFSTRHLRTPGARRHVPIDALQ